MRFSLTFILLFSTCATAFAVNNAAVPQNSLFFTPEEAHQAELLAQKNKPPGEGDINLGAVFYYTPNDWVLWLRGEKWTPETARDDIKIERVTANEVQLLWKAQDGSGQRELILQPDETYQISTGIIIREP